MRLAHPPANKTKRAGSKRVLAFFSQLWKSWSRIWAASVKRAGSWPFSSPKAMNSTARGLNRKGVSRAMADREEPAITALSSRAAWSRKIPAGRIPEAWGRAWSRGSPPRRSRARSRRKRISQKDRSSRETKGQDGSQRSLSFQRNTGRLPRARIPRRSSRRWLWKKSWQASSTRNPLPGCSPKEAYRSPKRGTSHQQKQDPIAKAKQRTRAG